MATKWQQLVNWSEPKPISSLIVYGARTVIPKEHGYYVFLDGYYPTPNPDHCLYLGIAARQTLYKRLGSYLRRSVTATKAERMKHRGKRLLAFARIKGLEGTGTASLNTADLDRKIHVAWAVSPLEHNGAYAADSLEVAYHLERAMVDYYRPLFNTADWGRDNDFDFEDDIDWELEDA